MKTPLNQKQKNRLRRLLRVKDEGEIGIIKEINDLEDKLEGLGKLKGEKGDTPTDAELLALIRPLIPRPVKGEKGDTATSDELLELIRPLIPQVKDGETPSDERLLALIQPLIPEPKHGKDGSPDTPEQVVAKLSSLEGDDRLDASAIKGLTELLEEAKRLLTPSRVGGFFGGRVAHIPMVDDFSTLTDGSTKTFYLSKAPRSVTTMKIWGSDFPYILRANTDFTVAGKLLTLTAEVDAPSLGATLIVEYYV